MSNNESMLYSGLYLIKMADEGMSTDLLKKAIEDLQNTIYVRESVPF